MSYWTTGFEVDFRMILSLKVDPGRCELRTLEIKLKFGWFGFYGISTIKS